MKIKSQEDKSFRPLEENKDVSFSLSRGLEFKFDDEDNSITFKASSLTGIEKVLINNQICSKKRTFGRHTKHQFQFNGNEYVLELTLKSIFKYTWTCKLSKNGELLKKIECINTQNKQSFIKKQPELIFGGAIGLVFALGYISLTAVLIMLIVGTIFSVSYMKRFLFVRESLFQSF